METGVVKFFNEAQGYGFIIDDYSGREIYVYATGLVDKVQRNDRVTFEMAKGDKGLTAVNVKKT